MAAPGEPALPGMETEQKPATERDRKVAAEEEHKEDDGDAGA
jgi:hypothetical protein